MSDEAPSPRLLAIDDSELIHRLLQVRLQGERLELHGALSAQEGLQKARELMPEVILLDIELDTMDGFEVLAHLKSDPKTQDIAVIFISAVSDTMDRVRGLDLGAVDFIAKPFEVAELKARVRSALRMQRLVHDVTNLAGQRHGQSRRLGCARLIMTSLVFKFKIN